MCTEDRSTKINSIKKTTLRKTQVIRPLLTLLFYAHNCRQAYLITLQPANQT